MTTFVQKSNNLFDLSDVGVARNPSFAAPVTNPFGLSIVYDNSAPTFVDIDGDGD